MRYEVQCLAIATNFPVQIRAGAGRTTAIGAGERSLLWVVSSGLSLRADDGRARGTAYRTTVRKWGGLSQSDSSIIHRLFHRADVIEVRRGRANYDAGKTDTLPHTIRTIRSMHQATFC